MFIVHSLYSFSLRLNKRLHVMAFRSVSAAELYVHLSSHCWSNRSPKQPFPGVLSGFSTVCLELAARNNSERRVSVCFKSRLITLFTQAFNEHLSDLPPAPLKLRLYKFYYYFFTLGGYVPDRISTKTLRTAVSVEWYAR